MDGVGFSLEALASAAAATAAVGDLDERHHSSSSSTPPSGEHSTRTDNGDGPSPSSTIHNHLGASASTHNHPGVSGSTHSLGAASCSTHSLGAASCSTRSSSSHSTAFAPSHSTGSRPSYSNAGGQRSSSRTSTSTSTSRSSSIRIDYSGFPTNGDSSYNSAAAIQNNLAAVDGLAPPTPLGATRNVLQPLARASSNSNATNQITPPTKPRAKSQKNSIIFSGLKHHIPGFVVGCPLPAMFGNYPPGLLKNLRQIKVAHSTIPFEMKNPRSDLWFVNELIKKTFKQPNGFYATSGQKKFTPLPKQIPPAPFYQAPQLEDDTQAPHDLAAIGNYCSFVGKEGLEQLLVDCKDRCETPRVSCKWKALQTSAKGAAIAATQGTSSQAVGAFDSKKRKEEFIVQSQSYSTVQAAKKRRSGDDPATTHRQFFDRHAKHAARSLQKTTRTLLQRADRSQVEVTYGGFAETLTVQHNKIPKVSNLGGNWKKGEFTECIQIQARNQSALEGLIDTLKNITFGDNNKHNTNECVQVHTWYADDKRSLPCEVEEARRSRDPRKKQRTESLGSESQNTATIDGSTIVMPSLCDEEEDEMDVDDDCCMWF